VALEGYVRTEDKRCQAEPDAWCLFAVDKAIKRIEVRGQVLVFFEAVLPSRGHGAYVL